jgi:histone deacetylase 11
MRGNSVSGKLEMSRKKYIIKIILLVFLISQFYGFGEGNHVKIPIVYSKHYNISVFGLQRLHAFDTEKYGKVFRYLVDSVGIEERRFFKPTPVTDDELMRVHTREYLESLRRSRTIASIAELPLLSFIPNRFLQRVILNPMRYGVGGTILGARLAYEYGWAINLSGGYHHAKANSGEGFCFFADIPLAVYSLFRENPDLSVLIIDLDAHQGNGLESIFREDERIYILDMYNRDIYPQDYEVKKYIDYDVQTETGVVTDEYLSALEGILLSAFQEVNPNFVVYNAGTDIYENDPLGSMCISKEGILQRDSMVFSLALERNIPILMVLSGGYTMESSTIIAESIENILLNIVTDCFGDIYITVE